MKPTQAAIKITTSVGKVCLLTACFASILISAEKTYSPKSGDETEILSLVLKAEFLANNWSKSELICFSVAEIDPSPNLVRALRRRDLNLRSSAEWTKNFNCGFEVRLSYVQFDLTQNITVRSQVVDLREINKGQDHFALLQRDGEYVVTKTDGKWSISNYIPKKQGAQP